MSKVKATKAGFVKPFKCSECLHFNGIPLNGHDQVCSKEGVRAGRPAPNCFTPDVTQLTQSSDQFAQIVGITQGLTRIQKRVLFGILNSKVRKLEFGVKVYFRAIGKDYLSNYLSGFVVASTRGGGIVVMGDPDTKKRGKPYLAIFQDSDELLTESEFRVRRKKLIAKGHLNDPTKLVLKKTVAEDYEPPTIDSRLGRKVMKDYTNAPVDKVITDSGKVEAFVVTSKKDRHSKK